MNRQSSLPDYDRALATILRHVQPLGSRRVELADAAGTILRRDVVADRDQPPFDRSTMDGFAVRSDEVRAGSTFDVAGVIAAGAAIATFPPERASVLRIATGAAVPEGADAVVPIEQARVEEVGEHERVRFTADSVEAGANIHGRGSDARAGSVVLEVGTRLGPNHLGVAASMGATCLEVAQVPRVTLLTTGDEVRPPRTPTAALEPQQIRSSNGPMMAVFLEAIGVPLLHHEHLPDEPEQTLAAAREAIGRSQLVLTVGGVSVGERDLLPWAWNRLTLEPVLHGVAIQPGKPLFVARDERKLVVGLPGNPVSVLATAHLFVWPIIRALLKQPADLPWRTVTLARAIRARSDRQVFRSARLGGDGRAEVIEWHGSGDLVHTASADGLVRLPLIDGTVEAAAQVPFLAMVQ